MKTIYISVILFITFSCKEAVLSKNQLVGTWKLVSQCVNNGQSSCSEEILSSEKLVTITFTNDDKYLENYKNAMANKYGFLGCGGSYSLEGKQVRIKGFCMSNINGRLYDFTIINDNQLIIEVDYLGKFIYQKQ
jgi:Lipocalin-like domain